MDNQNYKFTKTHTDIAKGVAVFLMICHHLFGFSNRLRDVSYISVIPLSNNYYEHLFARFGGICVSMFLFLSGYGLYISYMKKGDFTFSDSLKKMSSFLTNYWVVFILFVPMRFLWFNDNAAYVWDFKMFLSNYFVLSSSYNSEWWFARLYIELLLLFPIIKYFLNKNIIGSISTSILLCFLSLKLDVIFTLFPQLSFVKSSLLYNDIKVILLWQTIFVFGCLSSKYGLFEQVNSYLVKKKLDKKLFYIIISLIIVVIKLKIPKLVDINQNHIDIFITPIFIFTCTNIISSLKIKNIFIFFGKYSMNIWLTHTFFIYYYFQKMVYYPKLSVLIVVWACLLSLLSSIVIELILSESHKIIQYINSKTNETITILRDL